MLFFFFKQKTAYEMRISDWSSDVCSSDLDRNRCGVHGVGSLSEGASRRGESGVIRLLIGTAALTLPVMAMAQEGAQVDPNDEVVIAEYRYDPHDIVVRGGLLRHDQGDEGIGRAWCRERGCQQG